MNPTPKEMTPDQFNAQSGPGWAVLKELYATNRAADLSGTVRELEIAGVPLRTGAVLYNLVRQHRPRQTLETGFAYGFSSLFILQALTDNGIGVHEAIDPAETHRWHGIGLANVRRAGFAPIFNHLEMPSHFALPSQLLNGFQVDFAFIDGSHLFDDTLLDAYYIDRMLSMNGILVFDDWDWMPAVRAAVSFVETNLSYAVLPTPQAPKLRVLQKIRKPARGWDHFVPFEVLTCDELKRCSAPATPAAQPPLQPPPVAPVGPGPTAMREALGKLTVAATAPTPVATPVAAFRERQRDLIYDVGMNNGDDTAYYLHRGFRVVAVEADPDLCAKAAARFAEPLKTGQLVILNVGVAAKPGAMDFWICESNSHWNSFDRRISSRDNAPHHSIPVSCRTFDTILKQYGVPHYLKIDIEGHDYLCVEALRSLNLLPDYLSVEVGKLDYFLEKLTALGYGEFKCVSQFNFLPLELPPSPEQVRFEAGDTRHLRRWRDWTFPPGASGPFGEDTFGRWLGADEIRRAHQHYQNLYDQRASSPFWYGKNYSFWLDLHARRTGVEAAPTIDLAGAQGIRPEPLFAAVRNHPDLVAR